MGKRIVEIYNHDDEKIYINKYNVISIIEQSDHLEILMLDGTHYICTMLIKQLINLLNT